jgi:hypothetical protein
VIAPILIPSGIALLGLFASVYGAWRTIQNEREKTLAQIRAEVNQATHEKRLELYAELTKAMSPLALFFPQYELDRYRCLQIGRAMSHWYFTTGGLLLSGEARDEYFRLARAVSKAFLSDTLFTPAREQYAKSLNDKKNGGVSRRAWPLPRSRVGRANEGKRRELGVRQVVRRGKGESRGKDKRRTSICVQRLCSLANAQQSTSISVGRGHREPPATFGRAAPDAIASLLRFLLPSPGGGCAQNAASSNAGSTDRPHGPS